MTSAQRVAISIYTVILATCLAMLLLSDFVNPSTREVMLPLSSDGFKMSVGALVGVASVMFGKEKHPVA